MRITGPIPAAWNTNQSRANPIPTNMQNPQNVRQDSLHISGAGRAAGKRQGSMLDMMMKQRDSIQEQRRLLVENATDENGGLDAIKGQLKDLDDLLANLDEQIQQVMVDQAQKSAEDEKKEKPDLIDQKDASERIPTREEAAGEQAAALIDIGADFEKMQTLSSVQTRIEGRFNTLEQEIALDESRAPDGRANQSKYVERSELKAHFKQSSNIQANLMEKIADRIEETSQDNSGAKETETVRATSPMEAQVPAQEAAQPSAPVPSAAVPVFNSGVL